jgi:hypothetical protein
METTEIEMSIDEAMAELIKEFPALGKVDYHSVMDHENAWVVTFSIQEATLRVEKFEADDYGKLEPLWDIIFINRCSANFTATLGTRYNPTLADAIAAIRQAKAQHLKALEVLG